MPALFKRTIHWTKNDVSNKDFLSRCYQIRGFLRIWSYLLKKSLMENFIFCAVITPKKQLLSNQAVQ